MNRYKWPLFIACLMFVLGAYAQPSASNAPTGVSAPKGGSANIPLPLAYNAQSTVPVRFNYTRTWSPVAPTTSATLPQSPSEFIMTSTYTNGFGSPLQVNMRLTKDIITPISQSVLIEKVSYLPYVAATSAVGFQMSPFADQQAYYNSTYASEDDNAYSRSKSISSSGQQFMTTYPAGMSGTGTGRGTTISKEINGGGIIRFGLADALNDRYPVKEGTYNQGDLMVSKTEGQHGIMVKEYYNKTNQLICKVAETGTANNSKLAYTYFVYDQLGRITWVITPKAVEALEAAGWPYLGAVLDVYNNLCYGTRYNEFGLTIERRIPGKVGKECTVYDKKNRPVLFRNPLMESKGKWSFTVYDKQDRVVLNGELNSNSSRASWQGLISGSSSFGSGTIEKYLHDGFEGPYPTSISGCDINNYNFYDSYDFGPTLPYSRNYSTAYDSKLGNASTNVMPHPYSFVKGKLTGSKVRVINNGSLNQWINSIYYYDQQGRPIQVHCQNPLSSNDWDVVTNQYNFNGTLANTIIDHHGFAGSAKPGTLMILRNYYEAGQLGRIITQKIKLDDRPEVTLAAYTYDELGRVSAKSIGNGVEKQVYTYNIRGQLAGINEDYISNPAYANATFGCKLLYDYGFEKPRYDGSLSGLVWRGAGTGAEIRAYGYEYDNAGRLIGADFNEATGAIWGLGQSWSKNIHDFSVSNITYDGNGNMLSMKQRGSVMNGGVANPIDLDNLTYNYHSRSNRLESVEDTEPDHLLNDFVNRNAGTTDYSYDANGNVTADLNKAITSVNYNTQDQPETVSSSTNGQVDNVYDANGTLVQKTITAPGRATEVYNYWGPFVYANQNLSYILNSEGRVRWKNGYSYDYFIKDHLGNVRSVVNYDVASIKDYRATHEFASANTEHMIFEMPTTGAKPGGSPGDMAAALLNGADSKRRIGTSTLLKVMAGDKFKAQVSAYYDPKEYKPNSESTPNSEMFSALLGALSGGITNVGNENGGTKFLDNLMSSDQFTAVYGNLKDQHTDPSRPKAFLNYVLLNEDMKVIDGQSGALQVNADCEANWGTLEMENEIVVGSNGYLLAYMSNESAVEVAMDEFLITYSRGKLLEESHYYPHGLVASVGSSTPLANRYSYQGKEMQTEVGMQLMDFHLRQYDPQIGRFMGVDPMDEFPSGYIGMGNNPANLTDPTGGQTNYVNPQGNFQAPYQFVSHLTDLGPEDAYYQYLLGGGNGGGAKGSAEDYRGFEFRLNMEIRLAELAAKSPSLDIGYYAKYRGGQFTGFGYSYGLVTTTNEVGYTTNQSVERHWGFLNVPGYGLKEITRNVSAAAVEESAVGIGVSRIGLALGTAAMTVTGVLLPVSSPYGTGSLHGNSRQNENEHNLYMIYYSQKGGLGDVYKYGITGRIDFPERRPQYQVNKYNRRMDGRKYDWAWVQTGFPNRQEALYAEVYYVTMYYYANGQVPEGNRRPGSNINLWGPSGRPFPKF